METPAPTAVGAPLGDRARQVGLGLVTLLTVALTVGASAQILGAVFSPAEVGAAPACRVGIQGLLAGVTRARAQAAARVEGERASLRAFRQALAPEWSHAAAIEADCHRQRDRDALAAFRQVDLLRYAEERAVRYEALDLSLLRKRAPDLVGSLAPHQP